MTPRVLCVFVKRVCGQSLAWGNRFLFSHSSSNAYEQKSRQHAGKNIKKPLLCAQRGRDYDYSTFSVCVFFLCVAGRLLHLFGKNIACFLIKPCDCVCARTVRWMRGPSFISESRLDLTVSASACQADRFRECFVRWVSSAWRGRTHTTYTYI